MTSKNSFLVSIKENNKRRLWVWTLSALAFVLGFPAYVALLINTIIRSNKWIGESYGSTVAQQIIHEKLINSMCHVLGLNLMIPILVAAIALISAVQGFSYLYSRKKIDFYMGMPVKRKKRFFIIWLNGILVYVIPYLAGLIISMLIAAGNGAMDKTVFYSAAIALLVNLCLYLGIYHMTILAVMLTGNIVITGFAFIIFCSYEFIVRMVLEGYKEIFFKYFSYYGSDTTPMLSPFSMYFKLLNAFNYTQRIDLKYLMELLAFAAIVGGIAYFCYLKRPAEAAGKAITFEIIKPFIKILVVVVTALLMGGIISDAVSFFPEESMDGIGWIIFVMTLTVIIGSALIQVIYEFDIKGSFHKKSHIVVSGILVTLIFITFRYDLLGYDSYIPKQGQIESIAFIPEDYHCETPEYGDVRFDDDGRYMSVQAYAGKYMYLNNVEEICEMVDYSMEEYNKIDRYKDTYDTQQQWSYVTIIYRLKNGREVVRCLWVDMDDDRTVATLDNIIGSEEFKKGFIMGASDTLIAMMDNKFEKYKISALYGNTVYEEKMSSTEAKEFLEIYQKDLASVNFSNIRENVPSGIFSLDISEEIYGSAYMGMNGSMSRATRGWTANMYIYPFYEESIAYLKEHGYYMGEQVNLEDIAKIQVINNNYEIAEELREKQLTAVGAAAIMEMEDPAALLELGAAQSVYGDVDTRVYVDYTDEDKLKEIIDYIYPNDMVMDDWDNGKALNRDYEVIVYFKTDSDMTRDYGTNAYYRFLKGEVPDFVSEDTRYKKF